MKPTPVGGKHSVSSTQLLVAAGLALGMAIVGAKAYPYLVSFGAPGVLLTVVRAVTLTCLVAIVVLPLAAIIRRLIR